jgi:multidrug resistance protein, MATE family
MSAHPTTSSDPAAVLPPGERPSFAQESRATLGLAFPLIAGQLGQMLMHVADAVMLGQVGIVPLAAATFTNTLISVPFILGIGLLTSVAVRVSNARGAERPEDAHDALRHGTWLALGYGLLVVAVVALLLPFLHWFGQPAEVTRATPAFLMLMAASLVPALLSLAWKDHTDALGHPWPTFGIFLGGVVLNIGLNWLWIYGNWGFPALGLMGAGLGTLVARIVTAAFMLWWLLRAKRLRVWVPRERWADVHRAGFGRLLAIGIPASLGLLTEVGAFSAASLLIGTLGTVPLAAHQVAITCAAAAFMVPLGVAMAMTVRIGALVGAEAWERMHRVLVGGWLFGAGFMALSMICFLGAGEWLARTFVADQEVIALAVKLLVVAGVFQLFDGMQVVSAGALRGRGDVRVPALLTLIAYWAIALPLGAWLALKASYGAVGMWTGLAAGLAVAALVLGRRAWVKLRAG